MRNRQTRIVIGVLVGLVLFASSIALLMYSKQSSLSQYVEGHVNVYVTSKHLALGHKITQSDITKASLPKSYLAFTPLTESEIVGRYTTVQMFAKEPLRREKISTTKPITKQVVVPKKEVVKVQKKQVSSHDTITVSLNIFKNIDSSLKKGDTIDIISVISKRSNTNNTNYSTKYIVLSAKINSFVSNFSHTKKYITKGQKGSLIADSVVFEMSPEDIKNFLSVYYTTQELNSKRVLNSKTGHLWMVKRSRVVNVKDEKLKKSMMIDHKQKVYRKRRAAAPKVSISYED